MGTFPAPSKKKSQCEYSLRDIYLSLCGKRYYGIEVKHCRRQPSPSGDLDTQYEYCWSAEQANKWSSASDFTFMDHIADKDAWGPKDDDWSNLEYGSPIVLEYADWHQIRVIKNPCLKELGFSGVIDPYTVFQEISMFLAGPLAGYEDPDLTPEPTGAEKMASKGMDPKYGFRKLPEKK